MFKHTGVICCVDASMALIRSGFSATLAFFVCALAVCHAGIPAGEVGVVKRGRGEILWGDSGAGSRGPHSIAHRRHTPTLVRL